MYTVIIAKNYKIVLAVRLGLYVSVGDNCKLQKCNIQDSIIMSDCTIDAKVDFEHSIKAHGSEVEGSDVPNKC